MNEPTGLAAEIAPWALTKRERQIVVASLASAAHTSIARRVGITEHVVKAARRELLLKSKHRTLEEMAEALRAKLLGW
jgi:FixJ family two-component response regulator